jgi:SAM-dependent methyltransferase
MSAVQDTLNRSAWSLIESHDWLRSLQGFTDAGEVAAFARLAGEMRGLPILELGVGAGRAVPLLRNLSPDYIGIDYLAPMVELTRQRYPDADVRLGDARDLSAFESDRFALVVFSFMGIDAVDHSGRQRILAEACRVLRPGGVFWFSTLNLTGPHARERPWNYERPGLGQKRFLMEALRWAWRYPRRHLAYRRHYRLRVDGEGWAVAPFSAHDFSLLVHYTTLQAQLHELARAGFGSDPVFLENAHGTEIGAADRLEPIEAFNVLARKPTTVGERAVTPIPTI